MKEEERRNQREGKKSINKKGEKDGKVWNKNGKERREKWTRMKKIWKMDEEKDGKERRKLWEKKTRKKKMEKKTRKRKKKKKENNKKKRQELEWKQSWEKRSIK